MHRVARCFCKVSVTTADLLMTVDQQETVAHQSSIFTVLLNWIFPLEPCQISTPEEVGDDWSTILSFILLIKCRDAIGEMLTGDGGA
ncbi:hypothetical protein RUM44_003560 [Polyplax serrata]|uniref:Uncharacterized protein n=1 Tax=Polyplax serrata TaxID=468196 RepID=A0ABR1AGS9_POLSC